MTRMSFSFLTFVSAMILSTQSFAERFSTYEQVKHDTEQKVRTTVDSLLLKHCGEACQLISVGVTLQEAVPETFDLGFEGIGEAIEGPMFSVANLSVEIQIDKNISRENRERLQKIVSFHLKATGPSEIVFYDIETPQIGKYSSEANLVKRDVEQQLETAVESTIREYCPDACILSYVLVKGRAVAPDEASVYPPLEIVRSKTGLTYFHVDEAEVSLSIDEGINELAREQILDVLKAHLDFVRPVTFKVDVRRFPETFARKKEREHAESDDPFGLEKLRRMLIMFKELAGTKEIISTSEAREALKEEKERTEGEGTRWILYILVVIIVTGLLAFIILKYASANRDAHYLMHTLGAGKKEDEGVKKELGVKDKTDIDVTLRMRVEDLKDHLIQIFLNSPKVSRETFGRLLHEDGVEETAKFLHILGKLMVYELVDDPTLQRNLFELVEFYNKSEFSFSLKEQEELLLKLKTKVLANEIRVLTQKTIEQFEFLGKLDPGQVYALIRDENPRVQSIVLTQLPPLQRRAVFNTFQGAGRTKLLSELSRADAIPKEFLANVAQALNKKVVSKPEFDTQHIRASDVLLDLMERSELDEQRVLMRRLEETNPDTARTIKLRMVTIEMLPYLKAGHLLELVMGFEREDLLIFLAGTREHIRELLLAHAPAELAESWLEDLETVVAVDEKRYLIVESMVLNKIRNMASDGIINLLDINEVMFAPEQTETSEEENFEMDRQNVVA
ncbi:MAG: hypothetical protein HYW48_10280 [Deltaproteobacteria bacterium]|nr:hypothetical protein [Deltaproteobacteria bacterium]